MCPRLVLRAGRLLWLLSGPCSLRVPLRITPGLPSLSGAVEAPEHRWRRRRRHVRRHSVRKLVVAGIKVRRGLGHLAGSRRRPRRMRRRLLLQRYRTLHELALWACELTLR